LGSTGSIGTQTLEVIDAHPERFAAEVLTANHNAALLIEQARKYAPNAVVIADEDRYEEVRAALAPLDIKVYTGTNALAEVVEMETVDLVLTALVGFSGLVPTLRALRAGKPVALANKETLVVAGELVTAAAAEADVPLLPIDSEHSAIFQCLVGEWHNPVEKVILTASGGPFRGRTRADLADATRAQALKHPNWAMGAKNTIDSATLMNKGLEVIEARWMFDLEPDQIEVLVHPQSIVHSLILFEDGNLKAQLSPPDMRLPIQYALAYPARVKNEFPRFSFLDCPALTFEPPDVETFRNLPLALDAMRRGGNASCAVNAANEVAVAAFLRDEVGFLQMSDVIEAAVARVPHVAHPSLDDYLATDREARRRAEEQVAGAAG
ncbi:MAG: 1-deoxy-D-xylulose-5-phosphate reductoisomerase, partial [Catalinimonas sp.]